MYKFSIFIPTYNRAHTLPRLLESITQQEYKNFECIIVDDGSNDNTKSVIENVQQQCNFKLRYYYQSNSGKHVARNKAIMLAEGEFFLTIDSDDKLLPNTLSNMLDIWNGIPEYEYYKFAGVEGLCADMNTKKIIGNKFPQDILDSNHLETRYIHHIKGDKIRFIRTVIFRKHLFPVINDEKFISESIIWNEIGKDYSFRYVNNIYAEVEYQTDGLSKKSRDIRTSNPKGCRLYSMRLLSYYSKEFKPKRIYIYKNIINYFRFSFHSNISIHQQFREITITYSALFLFIFGYLFYLYDLYKTGA